MEGLGNPSVEPQAQTHMGGGLPALLPRHRRSILTRMRSMEEQPPKVQPLVPAATANAVTTPDVPPPVALQLLPQSGRHRVGLRAARGFSEALFSTREGPPPPERIEWLIRELDDLLVQAGWRSAGFYKLALIAVSLLAPLFIRSIRPLWSLPLDSRVRALTRMEESRLASVVLAAKSMVCIIYYEHPDARREIGHTTRVKP